MADTPNQRARILRAMPQPSNRGHARSSRSSPRLARINPGIYVGMEPRHWICAGHAPFDRRLEEIVTLARRHAWHGLDAAWGAFASELVDHLDYEECEIFDDFGRESGAQALALTPLLADHAALRARLETITTEIRARNVRSETFAAFIELLREHAEREDATVYPWLEQRRGRHARSDRTL
jgi:hypothetical protein